MDGQNIPTSGDPATDLLMGGLQSIYALYGLGGVATIGGIAWAIIYTYRIWPLRLAARDAAAKLQMQEAATKEAEYKFKEAELASRSQSQPTGLLCPRHPEVLAALKRLNIRVTSIENRLLTVENKQNHCSNKTSESFKRTEEGMGSLVTSVAEFKKDFKTVVDKIEDRLWALHNNKHSE